MSAATPGAAVEATPTQAAVEQTPRTKEKTEQEQRPPQQEELLCTICHMPSCWR